MSKATEAFARLKLMIEHFPNVARSEMAKDVTEVLNALEDPLKYGLLGTCPHCGKSTKPQTYGEKIAKGLIFNDFNSPPQSLESLREKIAAALDKAFVDGSDATIKSQQERT